MSEQFFEYGQEVRVIRNIRDDGTFPGSHRGEVLIPRGSVGFVRNRGTFLQDQVIYEIHFIDCGDRVVGCREEELIDLDTEWIPSRFEFRERVEAAKKLVINDECLAEIGADRQVLKVVKQNGSVLYHVRFSDRTLMVPEGALRPLTEGAG